MIKIKHLCDECLKYFNKIVFYKGKAYCRRCYNKVMTKCKFGRGPSYQYLVRMLTTKNKTGDVFGLTIPREVVEKYNLFHSKFELNISKRGKFILYTRADGKSKNS